MRVLIGMLGAVAVSACVVAAHPRPPPPRLLSAQGAVDAATYYARSRGLVIDHTRAVRLDRHARWHVSLGGAGGRDRAAVVLDGYSGQVLAARLRGPRGEWVPEQAPAAAGPPGPAPAEPPLDLPPPPPGAAPPQSGEVPPPPATDAPPPPPR